VYPVRCGNNYSRDPIFFQTGPCEVKPYLYILAADVSILSKTCLLEGSGRLTIRKVQAVKSSRMEARTLMDDSHSEKGLILFGLKPQMKRFSIGV
jgi:hypothetical protein